MFIEHIRLSKQGRSHLITLKRYTGIKNWNTLCRWGFCASLSDRSRPPETPVPADSNVEMTWKTFGGEYAEIYSLLLKQRLMEDGLSLDSETLAHQFRLHLHRGIASLAGEQRIRSIADLIAYGLREEDA